MAEPRHGLIPQTLPTSATAGKLGGLKPRAAARGAAPWVPGALAYLVEGGRGRGAHHQGDADDRVAVEAVRVGHHHDARDGEDGGHDLDGRRKGGRGGARARRGCSREVGHARGQSPRRPCFGEQSAKSAPVSMSVAAWTGTISKGRRGGRSQQPAARRVPEGRLA